MSPDRPSPSPNDAKKSERRSGRPDQSWPRWSIWIVVGLLIAVLIIPSLFAQRESDSILHTLHYHVSFFSLFVAL